MIGSILSRVDTAEKLSIPQLQQAIQAGSIPAYMGVPLLEEKIAFEQRMRSAAAARMAQGQQPTIAEQVMDQAQTMGGIDQIPINAPELAGGGIVAFEEGGEVQRFQNQGAVLPVQARLRLREMMSPEERARFDTSGTIPDRLRSQISSQMPDMRAPVRMEGGRPVPVDTGTGEELGIAPPMEEAPVAPDMPQPNYGGIAGRATDIANALGLRPPEQAIPTVQEASKKTSDLFRESGYDEGLFASLQQDVAKQRESLDKDRSEARAYRIIEAGLGIMSGTSANFFENIGKGATPALRNLASDIKEIKKAERDYQLAEQNLKIKQNEAALGKAKITQGQIDKAQERAEKKEDDYLRAKSTLGNTLLSGEIQKDLARASWPGKATDFDKQWRQYLIDAKVRNETPSLDGFRRSLEGSRGELTYKDALSLAFQDKTLSLSDARAQAVQLMEEAKRIKGGSSQSSLPMPTKKEELKAGQVYQTPRGLAKWDGQNFTLVD